MAKEPCKNGSQRNKRVAFACWIIGWMGIVAVVALESWKWAVVMTSFLFIGLGFIAAGAYEE